MKTIHLECKECGNKQDSVVKAGVCVPFALCDKCGKKIETGEKCQ